MATDRTPEPRENRLGRRGPCANKAVPLCSPPCPLKSARRKTGCALPGCIIPNGKACLGCSNCGRFISLLKKRPTPNDLLTFPFGSCSPRNPLILNMSRRLRPGSPTRPVIFAAKLSDSEHKSRPHLVPQRDKGLIAAAKPDQEAGKHDDENLCAGRRCWTSRAGRGRNPPGCRATKSAAADGGPCTSPWP